MRVRIGNFTGREEAERQLQALRQDGLKGIILNLPQAYRPEVPPAVAEERVEKPFLLFSSSSALQSSLRPVVAEIVYLREFCFKISFAFCGLTLP